MAGTSQSEPPDRIHGLAFRDAHSLSAHLTRFRQSTFLVCALATASLVALSGVIGLVGLMVPHLARGLVGPPRMAALLRTKMIRYNLNCPCRSAQCAEVGAAKALTRRTTDEEPLSGWFAGATGCRRHRAAGSADVRTRPPSLRLLPLGAGSRLVGAALIAAALWAGFFWATSTPGGP